MDKLWDDDVDVVKILNLGDLNSVVNNFEQKRMTDNVREDDDDNTVSTF